MAEYLIPSYNLSKLEKKLDSIERKCMQYGCYFKYEKGEPRVEEFEKTYYHSDSYGQITGSHKGKVYIEVTPVTVEGNAKIEGWEFIGSVEPAGEGRNLVKAAFGKEIPDRFYTCDLECEHCGKKQSRTKTFIVRNLETGEYKQVGRTCLRSYTGGFDAEFAAAMEEFCDFQDMYSSDEDWIPMYKGPMDFGIVDVIACALESIAEEGYIKSTDRMDQSKTTKGIVENMLTGGKVPETRKAHAEEIVEWAKNLDANNNYLNNLKTLALAGHVSAKNLGIAVSMVPGFERNAEYEAEKARKEAERKAAEEERQAKAATSEYAGKIGDKVTFDVQLIRHITTIQGAYGSTEVYRIVDTDNHIYTWFAAGGFDCNADEANLAITKLSGTIKNLQEYKGEKQTVLTRVKVAERHKIYAYGEYGSTILDLSGVEKAKDLYASDKALTFKNQEEIKAYAEEHNLKAIKGSTTEYGFFSWILYEQGDERFTESVEESLTRIRNID